MLMLCPICAGEFQIRVASCPSCGCGLVAGTLDERLARELAALERKPVEFVELCRPRLHAVAMLIKQTLEHHEVTAIIQGGHSASVMPLLGFGGQLRILVAKEQLDYAGQIYRAYFERDEEEDFAAEED